MTELTVIKIDISDFQYLKKNIFWPHRSFGKDKFHYECEIRRRKFQYCEETTC